MGPAAIAEHVEAGFKPARWQETAMPLEPRQFRLELETQLRPFVLR